MAELEELTDDVLVELGVDGHLVEGEATRHFCDHCLELLLRSLHLLGRSFDLDAALLVRELYMDLRGREVCYVCFWVVPWMFSWCSFLSTQSLHE